MSRYIVLLTVVVMAGCARTINRTAERKIRDALPRYVGHARVWRAHVDSAPERTIRGDLRRVTIDGEDVDLKDAIRLAQLHIEMTGVQVDTRRQELESVEATTFEAAVAEPDLNAYLRGQAAAPDDPIRVQHVQLLDGHVRIEATRWLLGRAWPFTAVVEPRLESATHLAFDPDRMTVEGIRVPLPAAALRWLGDRLSAGFDFSTLPFPLRIMSFGVSPGRLSVNGTADVLHVLNAHITP